MEIIDGHRVLIWIEHDNGSEHWNLDNWANDIEARLYTLESFEKSCRTVPEVGGFAALEQPTEQGKGKWIEYPEGQEDTVWWWNERSKKAVPISRETLVSGDLWQPYDPAHPEPPSPPSEETK
jgi:hypothetical protein